MQTFGGFCNRNDTHRNDTRMALLLLTSSIWAFSFGLIGNRLAGLDPAVVAFARLALSLLAFLPFACRGAAPRPAPALKLLLLGGLQFGLMYLLYIESFRHLPSHAVALFTVTTPVYVALLAGARQPRRLPRPLLAALLAVLGAALVNWKTPGGDRLWLGFALVQGSNLCFAAGQLLYRRVMRAPGGVSNHQALTWMYAGAVMACLPFALRGWRVHGFAPDRGQLLVLLYLGVVASGLCFWLWNTGARQVRHAGTLAVMNNAKIPLGMALSLLLFDESADPWRLSLAGVALLAGVILCEWPAPRPAEAT
jgi:drug/metabolite transporter (DMT)-like permease